MHTLRRDPFAPLVMALESFDDATQSAVAATMLLQRTLVARTPVLGVDTPDEALAVCLEARGRVDLKQIADLLGSTPDEARDALGQLVYLDPADNELVPAPEYLSGNVRDKRDIAAAAAAERPEFAVNVSALQAVIPEDLGMDDVQARLGAAWIDAETHQEFLREILRDPKLVVEHPGGAVWGAKGANRSLEANNEWGMPASAIVNAVLEQRPIQVTDENATASGSSTPARPRPPSTSHPATSRRAATHWRPTGSATAESATSGSPLELWVKPGR